MNSTEVHEVVMRMLAAYRNTSETNDQVATYITAELVIAGLFKPPKAVASAAALAPAAGPPETPATKPPQKSLWMSRIETGLDCDDDECAVYLYCNECDSGVADDCSGWSIQDIVATCHQHWEEQHG